MLRGTAILGAPADLPSNDSFPLWSPHGVSGTLVFAPLCSFNKGPSGQSAHIDILCLWLISFLFMAVVEKGPFPDIFIR